MKINLPDKISNGQPLVFEFAEFSFDAGDKVLYKDNEIIQLAPKACELLDVFIENAGKLISKDELLNQVWADAFVEEANLTHHISALRKALGEDKNGRKFIETIPRRGYRFVAPVNAATDDGVAEIIISEKTKTAVSETIEIEPVENSPEAAMPLLPVAAKSDVQLIAPPKPKSLSSYNFNRAIVVVLLSGIVAAAVYFWFGRGGTAQKVKTIAVLPFKISEDAAGGDEYLKIGMTDALIAKLSGIKQITVRPTNSVIRYSNPNQDAIAAGKEIGVEAVIDGRIRKIADRFQISVQFIRTADGAVLWAENFERNVADIQNLSNPIAEKIAAALQLELTGEERKSLSKRYTDDTEAYQLYLQGRFYWYKWTPENWEKAAQYFQKAIEKDPNYALAYAGLADAYGVMIFASPPKDAYLKSKEAALKALELDASLAEPHITLGMLKTFYEWDRAAAREHLLRALELNPNNALAHDTYAIYLETEGRFDEAIAEAKRAQELDPLSPYMNGDLGMAYYYARRYDKAIGHLNKALEFDLNYIDALEYLAAIHEQKGEYAEAVNIWKRISDASSESADGENLSQVFNASGYKAAVEKRIEQLHRRAAQNYVSAMEFADNYARLGDWRQSFDSLKKAYEEKAPGLSRLKVEPRWDVFRNEPEFQELLRKINS